MLAGRDGEDLVKLLERQGLGFGHEEQDQHPADQAPCRVPAEGALGLEGGQEVRPGEGEDEVEAPPVRVDQISKRALSNERVDIKELELARHTL